MSEETGHIFNHLSASAFMKKKDIIINNFLGGIAWGFGTVVGATIVAAIIIGTLRSIGAFTGFSQLIKDINNINQEIRSTQNQQILR